MSLFVVTESGSLCIDTCKESEGGLLCEACAVAVHRIHLCGTVAAVGDRDCMVPDDTVSVLMQYSAKTSMRPLSSDASNHLFKPYPTQFFSSPSPPVPIPCCHQPMNA